MTLRGKKVKTSCAVDNETQVYSRRLPSNYPSLPWADKILVRHSRDCAARTKAMCRLPPLCISLPAGDAGAGQILHACCTVSQHLAAGEWRRETPVQFCQTSTNPLKQVLGDSHLSATRAGRRWGDGKGTERERDGEEFHMTIKEEGGKKQGEEEVKASPKTDMPTTGRDNHLLKLAPTNGPHLAIL